MKKGNSIKGITLIALVITIIVLLILAGVSIATLTGQNGILTQATKSKKETQIASEDELRRLTALEAATNIENTIYKDNSTEEEKSVIIPAGFAVSQVEGENTLKDGLVIIDKYGNEWVWIEVPKIITANVTTDQDIENALINYVGEYRATGYSDTWYDGCGLEKQEYLDKYSDMLQSIKLYGGFYIGRYEVGSFDNPVTSNDNTRKPVIQQGSYPYNYVTCKQAQELSKNLSIEGKTSSLMFGIQWDLVLKYLEVNGDWDTSENEVYYYLNTNSGSWGNYTNVSFPVTEGNKYAIYDHTNDILSNWNIISENYTKPDSGTENRVLLSTGATKRNSKMNIYDLAGNMIEWTLEKSSSPNTNFCTGRGGSFNGSDVGVASRNYHNATFSNSIYGFRVTMY